MVHYNYILSGHKVFWFPSYIIKTPTKTPHLLRGGRVTCGITGDGVKFANSFCNRPAENGGCRRITGMANLCMKVYYLS